MKVAERASQIKLLELNECPAGTLPNVIILSTFTWYITESDIYRHLCYIHPSQAPTTVRLYTNPVNGSSRGYCFVEYTLNKGNSMTLESKRARKHARSSDYSNAYSASINKATITKMDNNSSSSSSNPQRKADELLYALLNDVKQKVESIAMDGLVLTAHLCFLTSHRWDRNGNLPELPFDHTTQLSSSLSATLPSSSLSSAVSAAASSTKTIIGYGPQGFHVRCGATLHLPNTTTCDGIKQLHKLRKRYQQDEAARQETNHQEEHS